MKRNLIIFVIVATIVVAGVWGVLEFLSYKTVSFAPSENVDSYKLQSIVYEPSYKTTELGEYSSATSKKLKNGVYAIIPTGKTIDTSQINFEVTGSDITVAIDPAFSTAHLDALLTEEQQAIEQVYRQRYPKTSAEFLVHNTVLYRKGEWAGLLLIPVDMDLRNPERMYRTVAHKKDGSWKIVAAPELILTVHNTPDIDRDILRATNAISVK